MFPIQCSGCFLGFGNHIVVLLVGECFLLPVTVLALVFILFENLLFGCPHPPPPDPLLLQASERPTRLKPLHNTKIRPAATILGGFVGRGISSTLSMWDTYPSSTSGRHEDVDPAELGEYMRIHQTVSPSYLPLQDTNDIPVTELCNIYSHSRASCKPE